MISDSIYHYKEDRPSSRGLQWISFLLSPENGKKWNRFCLKLSLIRPDYPDPYYDDYIKFMESIIQNEQNSTTS